MHIVMHYLVVEGALDSSESISCGVFNLIDRMDVRSTNKDRTALAELGIFYKGILLLSESLFTDTARPAKYICLKVIK